MIIYDISDNNLRLLISETLKDYGLKRIQKSAFMGILQKHSLNLLLTDLRRMITVDSIIVFCICDLDFRNIIPIGKMLVEETENEVEFN